MGEKRLRIYRMGPEDTVIAYSKKQAIEYYVNLCGLDVDEIRECCEREGNLKKGFWWNYFNEKKIIERIRKLPECEYLKISHWNGDLAFWVSFEKVFKDQELLNALEIPGIICSTEY